jgi:hypothetical protein
MIFARVGAENRLRVCYLGKQHTARCFRLEIFCATVRILIVCATGALVVGVVVVVYL